MGFFDTLLTAIAPERAVKRVAAQTAIRAINSGYSNYGASLHKKSMRGWMWHGGSPKEDIEDNLRVLRERSRDAYMGVPLATGAIKTMRTNVVCGGLTPTPQIDNAFLGISDEEAQKINEQIAREFALWANKPTCDADRIDNFYMLQQLAFTGFLLNGDSWAVLQNKKTPGVPYDLRVRIIEADRICSPAFMDILSPTDINEHHVEKIVQGVETDADGMVIAYWVCDRHPLASTSVTGLTASHWTRVEAYGLELNQKTAIFPLRNGIDFLGFHSYLTDTGAVIQKLRRDSSKRMKNKIKYWETAYPAGEATKQEILRSFDAWDAHAAHGDTYSLRRKYADRLEKLLDCKIPIHRKINSNKLARDRRRARQCRCIYKKQHKALSLSVSQNTRPAEIMPWA